MSPDGSTHHCLWRIHTHTIDLELDQLPLHVLSRIWLFAVPWTVAHQSPLSMAFSRQEHWSGLPFPSPGDFPNPGIKTESLVFLHWQVFFLFVFLTAVTTWDYKEGWVPKNWCFWTVMWKRLLRVPWTARRSNQSILKEISPAWVFIGRTDVEAETPILWPPDAKSWLIWKDPDAGKDWGQEEKGTTEDEMVGWHHQLDRRGFGWTPGVGDGQGGLACCGSWGHKELDTTERLNWTEPPRKPSTSGLNVSVIGYTGIRRMHHPW